MADRAAHDINFEALTGLLSLRASPEVPGTLIGDIGAALHAAAGILAALYRRERTGGGAAVDVPIHDAALGWLLFPAARRLAGDADSGSIDLPVSGSHACYNIYRTSDDRYVALGALEPKFWSAFCDRIGRRDLVPLQYIRGEAQARALDEIRALMQTRSQADWLALFRDVDVCLTPVLSVADALSDPHCLERGVVARYGGCTYVTSPIAIGSSSSRVEIRPAPALGAHTEQVFAEAGITRSDLAALRKEGIV